MQFKFFKKDIINIIGSLYFLIQFIFRQGVQVKLCTQ